MQRCTFVHAHALGLDGRYSIVYVSIAINIRVVFSICLELRYVELYIINYLHCYIIGYIDTPALRHFYTYFSFLF